MIDPNSIEQLINDQVDGLLDPQTEEELMAWLQHHPQEYRQLQKTRQVKQLISLRRYESPDPEYFDQFLGKLHTRILQQEMLSLTTSTPAARKIPFRIPAPFQSPIGAGIAAVLVVFLSITVIKLLPVSDPVQQQAGNRNTSNPSPPAPRESPVEGTLVGAGPSGRGSTMTSPFMASGRPTGFEPPSSRLVPHDNRIDLEPIREQFDLIFDRYYQQQQLQNQQAGAGSDADSPPLRQYPTRRLRPPTMSSGFTF